MTVPVADQLKQHGETHRVQLARRGLWVFAMFAPTPVEPWAVLMRVLEAKRGKVLSVCYPEDWDAFQDLPVSRWPGAGTEGYRFPVDVRFGPAYGVAFIRMSPAVRTACESIGDRVPRTRWKSLDAARRELDDLADYVRHGRPSPGALQVVRR